MFFSTIKEVYGPTEPLTTPLLPADGSTLSKKKSSINARWREHVSTLLNRPSTEDTTVLEQIPQKPVIISVDLPPTIGEVLKEIRHTSLGKSTGMHGISAETFKSASQVALEALHSLLTSIWEEEDVPKEFRNATSVSIIKNRVSETDCGNYRGIYFLSVAGKILPRVILNDLITNNSGKPARRSVRIPFKPQPHRHELCTPGAGEMHRAEYGPRCRLHRPDESLRHCQQRSPLGDSVQAQCPTKFMKLIRQFQDDMTGKVFSDGEASEPFSISNVVKQGCVLAPVLFNLFFTCVINHATSNL